MSSSSKQRIAVAMSGGVDSSAVAAMMQEEGFEVLGLTMQLYPQGEEAAGSCCAGRDIYDARRVADKLGINHYVLDYQEAFHRDVIEDFADSYADGLTPIPCVRCNQRIKFEKLLDLAKSLGATALATGHYARRAVKKDGSPGLWRAKDLKRDQSYFLFATTKSQLEFLRFPLGHFTDKAQVRRYAAAAGLEVAEKPDSQDICFVAGDYRRLVRELRPEAAVAGELVDINGKRLGQHKGLASYTVGQRKGLGLGDVKGPLYVVKIDKAANRVVVGPKSVPSSVMAKSEVRLKQLNWLGDEEPGNFSSNCMVKWRSVQQPVDAELTVDCNAAKVVSREFSAVAPGQAMVFYRGERVLGGGWISSQSPPEAHLPPFG